MRPSRLSTGSTESTKKKWFQLEEDDARPTRRNTKVTDGKEERRKNVLKEESARLEIRRNCFCARASRIWNSIPDIVREQKSVNAFKNAFDKWKRNAKKTA